MCDKFSQDYYHVKSKLLNSKGIGPIVAPSSEINLIIKKSLNSEKQEQNEPLIQFSCLIRDIKAFIERNSIRDYSNLIFKIYQCRNGELICFIYTLNKSIEALKDVRIYGLSGGYHILEKANRDYLSLEVGVKLSCSSTPLEIKTINAGKHKRCGKGSLAISFLEEMAIPDFNEILLKGGRGDQIGYIYGISAELSPETDKIGRARFYSKNGFIMSNSHFYKYLR